MHSFSIQPARIKNDASAFRNCSSSLRMLSEGIRNVQQNLALKSAQSFHVKLILGNISESVLNEAAKADSLRDALLNIASAYQNAEKKLTGMAEEGTAAAGALADSSLVSQVTGYTAAKPWEVMLLFLKYYNDEEKLAEALQDHYMSYTAQSFLNKAEYSEKAWNKASLEERKAMLQSLMGELNALMGLSVSTCSFVRLTGNTRGQYSDGTNSLTINLNYIDPKNGRADSYMIMRTMIHEMRHAYQYAAINNPDQFNVSAETRQQWAENFKNYKDAQTYGYDEYVEQPIEYDAKRFAGQYQDIKGHTPTYAGTW